MPTADINLGLDPCGGFLSREVDALVSAWRAVWADNANGVGRTDSKVAPVQWREEKYAKRYV